MKKNLKFLIVIPTRQINDCIRKAICLDECNGPYQLCKPNGDYETCTQGTDGCYDFKLVKPTVY